MPGRAHRVCDAEKNSGGEARPMKRYRWLIIVAAALLAASATTYFIHYLFFRDVHHIMIYLVGDLAFLPLEVLFVVVVIERLFSRHEKQSVKRKMNMVIGTFFSELGVELLGSLTDCIDNREEIRPKLSVASTWTAKDYRNSMSFVRGFDFQVNVDRANLTWLRDTLTKHRTFLLVLLANPNLLEHEHFTDLLWAIFHLMEELTARPSLTELPETDRAHLAGDIRRVYAALSVQWLLYCRHLQQAYPFIFSIIVRTHPFQDAPSATVK